MSALVIPTVTPTEIQTPGACMFQRKTPPCVIKSVMFSLEPTRQGYVLGRCLTGRVQERCCC